MNQRRSRAALNRSGPHDTQTFGQILPFRRPGTTSIPLDESSGLDAADAAGLNDDLTDHFASYERERENDDLEEVVDYQHRMFMNVIAVAVLTLLVSTGVWLADTIAHMERDQDCIIQGRANCAPIELPMPAQP